MMNLYNLERIMANNTGNKKIAKNTLMLYIRMFFTMAVTLYTSRVVLSTLGVSDYGIYNVVGGMVAMFTFINSSMVNATQRFITFELGQGNKDRLHTVFCTSLNIHAIISIIIVLLVETVGLWFLYNKMQIPDGRINAAFWTLQCSIFATVVNVMSVPYNASIVAHEKMSAFAYISILEVTLKLLIVFLLMVSPFDKLILYAVLVLAVQIFIRLIYGIYCSRHFEETHYAFRMDKSLFKTMTSFAAFDLFGNLSVVARTQGINLLLNVFFGTILNAAAGVASQVQGAVMGFGNNVLMAVTPQLIKSYSVKDYDRMNYLLYKFTLITFILLLLLSMPIMQEANYILGIWLKEVPPYAVSLCKLTLIFGTANSFRLLSIGIEATGNIKRQSSILGCLYLSVIPITYILYELGATPEIPFVLNIIFVILGIFINAAILHIQMKEFSLIGFCKKVILKAVVIFAAFYVITLAAKSQLDEGFIRLIVVCFASLFTSILSVLCILNKEERQKAKQMVLAKFNNK